MSTGFHGRRRVVLAGAAVLATAVLAGPATASAPSRHLLAGSAPRWVSHARTVGATPKRQQIAFGVLLHMRNQAGAVRTLQTVSEPASAAYGNWLTNGQFDARYAPAHSQVVAVRSWLRAQGFTVTRTLRSGMYVEAAGSAAQVERTFATSLHQYRYHGATLRGNATPLSFPAATPAAVSGAVAGIIGIDQGSSLKQPASTEPGPPPGARYGVQPCSRYYGQKIGHRQAARVRAPSAPT